ncbi:MAG: hypothetical protein AAF748_03410 [Pseudomonadota bacterium]
MAKRVWLHIGTAKSGTTALQRVMAQNPDILNRHGLDHVSVPRLSSCNKLAIAINRNRAEDLQAYNEHFTSELSRDAESIALLSSEMLYGMPPERIFDALPILRDVDLSVLVYLRRQDRYIESSYLQKMKNNRFSGSIAAYIARFDGSGSDYYTKLEPWIAAPQPLHVRVCEPARLVGGSTISDALHVMGLDALAADLPTETRANPSPSLARLQILQALHAAGHGNTKRIQRALPPDTIGKARILTRQERDDFMARYGNNNERLRELYFPDWDTLFDMGDLDSDEPLHEPLSDAQIAELTGVFRALIADS